ncbi:nucleoside-specific channel-forming, Tsx family protein, partial [Vibrio harveyi]
MRKSLLALSLLA